MGQIREAISFVEGYRNGEWYDESDIQELVDNFKKLKNHWQPYVSVNHEQHPEYKGLAFGDVTDAKLAYVKLDKSTGKYELVPKSTPQAKAALILTATDVPQETVELYNSRRLPRISIEFFDHTAPFTFEDGRKIDTNVLKSMSLLGSQSEAVKGMPQAKAFADAKRIKYGKPAPRANFVTGIPKKFGAYPMMNREEMLTQLSEAGFPVDLITDEIPDERIAEIMEEQGIMSAGTDMPVEDAAAKAMAHAKKYMDGLEDEEAKKLFRDHCNKFMDEKEEEDDDNANMFGDDMDEEEVIGDVAKTKAFSDKKVSTLVNAQLQKAARKQTKHINDALKRHYEAMATEKIKAFGDKMLGVGGTEAYMTPIAFEAIKGVLERMDNTQIKSFSDGSVGTELDRQIKVFTEANATPVKKFGDKFTSPHDTPSNVDQTWVDSLLSTSGVHQGAQEKQRVAERQKMRAEQFN